jgi:hypothetical protein
MSVDNNKVSNRDGIQELHTGKDSYHQRDRAERYPSASVGSYLEIRFPLALLCSTWWYSYTYIQTFIHILYCLYATPVAEYKVYRY